MAEGFLDPYGHEEGVCPPPRPLPKRHVAAFECHTNARKACRARYHRPARTSPRGQSRKRVKYTRVRRDFDTNGNPLPTQLELGFVQTVSDFMGYELPSGYEKELWFIRAFLDVLSYGPDQAKKREVKRRCNIARDFVDMGYSYRNLEEKLRLSEAEAEVLHDYAVQRLRATWWKRLAPQDDALEPSPEEQPLRRSEWYDSPDDDVGAPSSLALDGAMEKIARAVEELAGGEEGEVVWSPDPDCLL